MANRDLSMNFERDLLKVARMPSRQLVELELHWPHLEKEIKRKRRQLASKIPNDDPLRFPIDLLTPLGRIADETLHTRALAYLLNDDNRHGLRRGVLCSLLETVRDTRRGTGALQVLALVNRKPTKISVTPEYRYSIKGFKDRSVARCDIWITIESRRNKALVVIENKIGALEGKGQLGWYRRKAHEWCRTHNAHAPIMIYLAPERVPKENWVSLSYVDLAAALRRVWRKSKYAGRAWLGLYIAAITNGVLEADLQGRPQDIDLDDLMTYLGRTHDRAKQSGDSRNLS